MSEEIEQHILLERIAKHSEKSDGKKTCPWDNSTILERMSLQSLSRYNWGIMKRYVNRDKKASHRVFATSTYMSYILNTGYLMSSSPYTYIHTFALVLENKEPI